MSKQIKLIIPLLNESLTKDDFTPEAGFVGAYTYNKNQPQLLRHLFLLYQSEDRNYRKAVTINKLNNLKSLYSWKTVRIGGKFYLLYTLALADVKTKKLLQGIPSLEYDDVIKTLRFWNLEDDDVNRILLGIDPSLDIDDTSVPEEDYSIPDITTEHGYKESLAMNTQSGFFLVFAGNTEYFNKTFYLFYRPYPPLRFLDLLFFFFFSTGFFLSNAYLLRPVPSKKLSRLMSPISVVCSYVAGNPNGRCHE